MAEILKGRAWVFGDDVDTDLIYHNKYLFETDPNNMPQLPDGDFDLNNMPQAPDGFLLPLAHAFARHVVMLSDRAQGHGLVGKQPTAQDEKFFFGKAGDELLKAGVQDVRHLGTGDMRFGGEILRGQEVHPGCAAAFVAHGDIQ